MCFIGFSPRDVASYRAKPFGAQNGSTPLAKRHAE